MKKIFSGFLTALTFLFFINISHAANGSDPVAMLKGVADQMISQLQARKATLHSNPSFVYSLANRLVVPHANLDEMSMRVLPPRVWQQASPTERAQFKKEFTTLLVRTYASALAEYKDEIIRFNPVRGGYQGRGSVQVDSTIVRTDGPSIPVSYRLSSQGGQWRLYDLIVDGVSLLESFRSQFADKLSQGNMADLIQDLRTHNGH